MGWERDIKLRSNKDPNYKLSQKLRSIRSNLGPPTQFSCNNMHSSPFIVAGMSSSTNTHHSPNLNSWESTSTGGPLASTFGDSLAQSRSHYQSGYLMVSFVDWTENRLLILAQSTSQSNVRILVALNITSINACFTQNAPPGNQRVDEVPVVQTKAKMNKILSRDSTTDFGMDSMFQSSRFV